MQTKPQLSPQLHHLKNMPTLKPRGLPPSNRLIALTFFMNFNTFLKTILREDIQFVIEAVVQKFTSSVQRYTLCTHPSPRYSCTSIGVIPRISMILRKLIPVFHLLINGNIRHLPFYLLFTPFLFRQFPRMLHTRSP